MFLLGLLCVSLTLRSLVFIIFILIIIDVNLIRVGLFRKLSQLTARGVTPGRKKKLGFCFNSL